MAYRPYLTKVCLYWIRLYRGLIILSTNVQCLETVCLLIFYMIYLLLLSPVVSLRLICQVNSRKAQYTWNENHVKMKSDRSRDEIIIITWRRLTWNSCESQDEFWFSLYFHVKAFQANSRKIIHLSGHFTQTSHEVWHANVKWIYFETQWSLYFSLNGSSTKDA